MITISFDIGMKNLAVCVFDKSRNILEWKVMDITNQPKHNTKKKKNDLISLGRNLKLEMDILMATIALLTLKDNNPPNFLILLENQIAPKASNMKSIQCMVMQYFIDVCDESAEIKFVSSKIKSSLFIMDKPSSPLTYAQRKRKAVETCGEMIKATSWNPLFTAKKTKKDDLADCYLQAVAYMQQQQ